MRIRKKDMEKLSLKELSSLTGDIIIKTWNEKGTLDMDKSMDTISYAAIKVFSRQHPECYLGRVNHHNDESFDLVKYDGQKEKYWGYDFILPVNDLELVEMIRIHNTPKKVFDGADLRKRVYDIHERIEKLGGQRLLWAF